MSSVSTQADSHDRPDQPPRRSQFATGCLAVLAGAVLGLSIGAGGGYFLYVKRPADFESTAIIQVTHKTAPETADALLILSDPVLIQAVSKGSLNRLPTLQPASSNRVLTPSDFLALLRERTKLRVVAVSPSSTAPVYEVRCNAASPSDCETVTNAVVASYIDYLSAAGDQADWQSAMQLLQSTHSQGLERIAELERQLGQVSVPTNASLQNDGVMSAESEQWSRLRSESERLHNAHLQATALLRETESLISDGAPADDILTALGMTIESPPAPDAQPDSTPNPIAEQAAEQRKIAIAERERIRAEVERDLLPLQQELDRLLKIVAAEHPKVRGVQLRMKKVRDRLDDLPPLPAMAPRRSPPESVDEPEEDIATPTKGALISGRLRALRTRRSELAQQMSDADEQLEQSARLVSEQKTGLQEDARIRGEIKVQQQMVERAIEQLAAIPTAPPVPQTHVTILRSANQGIQVAPLIWYHLLIGAIAGLLVGLVLAGLFLLTPGTAEPE